jgi:hypothetical protein
MSSYATYQPDHKTNGSPPPPDYAAADAEAAKHLEERDRKLKRTVRILRVGTRILDLGCSYLPFQLPNTLVLMVASQ